MERNPLAISSVTTHGTPRRRAFKACVYCRTRKAKCEFDDWDSKVTKPCIRCRREGKECVFLPSRRGGRFRRRHERINSPLPVEDAPPVADLAEAPLRNPSDALEILAQTSSVTFEAMEKSDNEGEGFVKAINLFPLVQLDVINSTQLRTFISIFLTRHHHYLPLIPRSRQPTNDLLLGKFAADEVFLLTAIVIVASRFENPPVHSASWKYMRGLISSIVFGGDPTVGVVEGLLLLSENIPRQPQASDNDLHHNDALLSWNLVGLAVRFSYFLGLDQKTLLSSDQVSDENTSRERLAWTYCYFHDRQVSIRLGKAFWSRGPGLCFQSPPEVGVGIASEAHLNFPTLAPNSEDKEDLASLVQAYVELTQILTNVHDTLYPSRDRTIALVQIGEYYRMLDEFTRTFAAFWVAWKDKQLWTTFPLKEIIWATFHYTKLYAYSFAFQAHVQRATNKTALYPGQTLADLIFPRGMAGSPDSKFIIEAIKSACDLLQICVDHLYPGGALAYLPARFYGFFSYAAVFLIKAMFTGAIVSEQKAILSLVQKVIWVFRAASSGIDRQHPGVRSARQLKTLLSTLQVATATSLAPTPEPQDTCIAPETIYEDNSHLDFGFSPVNIPTSLNLSEESDVGTQELTALLSTDLDSEMWLSFLD